MMMIAPPMRAIVSLLFANPLGGCCFGLKIFEARTRQEGEIRGDERQNAGRHEG
jgi:hypothetical protein